MSSDAASRLASFVPRWVACRLETGADEVPPITRPHAGAVLLLDIVGFTRTTESFMVAGTAGAERLSETLDVYFGKAIDAVSRHGGDVLAFAGDALIAGWLDGPEARVDSLLHRAASCAMDMQSLLPVVELPGGGHFQHRMALGAGGLSTLEAGVPGGPRSFFAYGEAIRQFASTHRLAPPGRIVVSPEVVRLGGAYLKVSQGPEATLLLDGVAPPAPPVPQPPIALSMAAVDLVPRYLPRVLFERTRAGHSDWLAEFRTVTALFVSLAPPQDSGAASVARVQHLTQELCSVLQRLDTTPYQVVVDEKGLRMVVVFGLPFEAHEDDAARAVRAAIDLRARLGDEPVSMGLATGRAFCGAYGTDVRRNYACLGATLNLAARLADASRSETLCDLQTVREASAKFHFDEGRTLDLKGCPAPVLARQPAGEVRPPDPRDEAIYGRSVECGRIRSLLQQVVARGRAHVLIRGEPGLGKSTLLAAAALEGVSLGLRQLPGRADPVERSTPYYIWRHILAESFGWGPATDADTRQRELKARLAGDEKLTAWAPVLNDLLGLALPESELTAQMANDSRVEAVRDLVVQLLSVSAASQPLLITIEDLQWLDSASCLLLLHVMRRLPAAGVIITSRPLPEPIPDEIRQLVTYPNLHVIELPALSIAAIEAIVARRLEVPSIPAELARFVLARSEGHPYYSEELASALLESGFLRVADGVCSLTAKAHDLDRADIPNSLERVITTRIDALQPRDQLAMKVSAVVGRTFPLRVVSEIYPVPEDSSQLPAAWKRLHGLDLVRPEAAGPDPAYAFKHAITWSVSYNLMPFAQRRELHRAAAQWYEKAFGQDDPSVYSVLAHHWRSAEDPARELKYLEKVATHAEHSFANREAVETFTSVIMLADRLPGSATAEQRARWELSLGEAQTKLSRLDVARTHLTRALELRGHPYPRTPGRLVGALLREVSRQTRHRLFPKRSLGAEKAGRDNLLAAASVHQILARVAYFEQDLGGLLYCTLMAMNLSERAGESRELALAYGAGCVVAGAMGLHGLAKAYRRSAVEIAERDGHLPTLAFSHLQAAIYDNMTADWAAAAVNTARAAELYARVGDRFLGSTALAVRLFMMIPSGQLETTRGLVLEAELVAPLDGGLQILVWCHCASLLVALWQGRETAALASELQGLLMKEPAPAEKTMAFGLIALARLRAGDEAGALAAAGDALQLMKKSPPSHQYNTWSVAGVAEVYLSVLERAPLVDPRRPMLLKSAAGACGYIRALTRITRVAKPRADLCAARLAAARGHFKAAGKAAEKALANARALAMPMEEALALELIARLLPTQDPARRDHLDAARTIFERLNASTDLERLAALPTPTRRGALAA